MNFLSKSTLVAFVGICLACSSCNTDSANRGAEKTKISVQSGNVSQEKKTDIPIPATFNYEGDATDELGNTVHYKLKIKSDFSSASIGGGPYTKLNHLSGGIYKWVEGTIIGVSLKPMKNSCDLYNIDDTYFCTLYRVE